MLKYYYITNDASVADVADNAGIDRIFVDLEYIGKEKRQPMDTVKNHHTVSDVINVRKAVKKAKLLVRINPLYDGTRGEIESVLDAGADMIMLPMWKSARDVRCVLDMIKGRAELIPLLETKEAAACINYVLSFNEINEIHIGLNDLSISLGKPFLFELLIDGTVDSLAETVKNSGKAFGVGGVGAVGLDVALKPENILAEQYRLGSDAVILSRSFCKAEDFESFEEFKNEFIKRLNKNREYEKMLSKCDSGYFKRVHSDTIDVIGKIIK